MHHAALSLLAALTLPGRLASAAAGIWLAGDSTMAEGGGGSGTQGWGHYLQYSFDSAQYQVHNEAVAGRSARSYTREGRFQAIADQLSSGDWVVVEMGHNDGGSLSSDNGRTDCPGQGAEVCYSEYDGANETIYTFPAYLEDAAGLFLARGARVVLSSKTPNNPWESGSFSWSADRFGYYAWYATQVLGGPAAGVYYVAHGDYAAQVEKNLGQSTVDAWFPNDHTHTAPELADKVAGAFVLGLACGTSALGDAIVNSTSALESSVLGGCITFNSTIAALE